MKKICIAAIGTRGDVLPALALSDILKERNEVQMITPPEHMPLCKQNGLDCLPIGDDFSKVAASGDIAYYRRQIEAQFTQHHSAYENADVIVGAGLFYAGRSLAEYFRKPYYHLFYTPQVLKSNQYAPAGTIRPFRGKTNNRLLWLKSVMESDFILKTLISKKRKDMGLDPIRSVYRYFIDRTDTIIALDARVALLPQRYRSYIRQIHTLRYEDPAPLNESLRAFLKNGEKPVLINFGSAECTSKTIPSLLRHTIDAAQGLKYRLVVVSAAAAGGYAENKNIFWCGYAPHPALLPQVGAIIHHGGIGTVCASLKYGAPQIIVPQGMDQYFWAEIIAKEKWGKAVYSNDRAFPAPLVNALRKVQSDPEIRGNIADISRWMNAEQYRQEGQRKLRLAMPACFQ